MTSCRAKKDQPACARSLFRFVALLVFLASGTALVPTVIAQGRPSPTPVPILHEGSPEAIPGQYVVVFRKGASRDVVQSAQRRAVALGATVVFAHHSQLLAAFSAKLPPTALDAMRLAAGVEYIEVDQLPREEVVQTNPPDGLDRTSERFLPLDRRYTYSETGQGVNVYVLDRGILRTHNEFTGITIGTGVDQVMDGNGTSDCGNGHGTFVAAIIAGATLGIAKQVTLHPVRAVDCTGNISGGVLAFAAAIDWVRMNAVRPAVLNISVSVSNSSLVSNAARAAVTSGIVVVAAAGNNNGNSCFRSPGDAKPEVITVGATNPVNDARWVASSMLGSNYGPCVNLFAPGENILSAGIANNSATRTDSGTSFAAPHVAGVAALYLQNHPTATPAAVWAAIDAAANKAPTTANWAGVGNLPTTHITANKLLHWGSRNDGMDDGDPHLTTVDGVYYDFQSAGEFVALREANGLEIHTRQKAVATPFNPAANPHTGLASCVSVNTAVAARVGGRRVTYQPGSTGGLWLRIDGARTLLGSAGVSLGPGARVMRSALGNGIRIDFPDQTVMIATGAFWPSQETSYLDLTVFNTPAKEGILGAVPAGGWLPVLPDGKSLGPRAAAAHDRYVALNQVFADAWRVTHAGSLFDYDPGTSTATFTDRAWPPENPPCALGASKPPNAIAPAGARKLCKAVSDANMRASCEYDVAVTGNPGFAASYLLTERIRSSSTRTTLDATAGATRLKEPVTFTARVSRLGAGQRVVSGERRVPGGFVQFLVDGRKAGVPVRLDARGEARWRTAGLAAGEHSVAARFIPGKTGALLSSTSFEVVHDVYR